MIQIIFMPPPWTIYDPTTLKNSYKTTSEVTTTCEECLIVNESLVNFTQLKSLYYNPEFSMT